MRRRIPAALIARRPDDPGPGAGPAAERRQRAADRGHGDPRRSTSRAAWPPTTSSRPGWRRPRRPPDASSSASRRRSSSASSRSATAASRSRSRRPTRPWCWPRSTGSPRSAGRRSAAGILTSLTTIAAAEDDPAPGYYTNRSPGADARTRRPCPDGTYAPAAIVLLTDGENNQPPDPLEAAAGRRPTAACASTRSASAARPGRRSRSRASRSTAGWTSRCSARSPRSPTAPTTPPRTRTS